MKPITPRTLAWIDQAPVSITRTRRIEASAATVWAAIADHERWTEWFDAITKIEVLGRGEGVGGGRRVHIGPVSVDEEFLAWDVDAHFAFTVPQMSRKLIKSLVESIRLTPDGPDATTVSYTMAVDPVGGAIVAALMRKGVPKALDKGLAGLDDHING